MHTCSKKKKKKRNHYIHFGIIVLGSCKYRDTQAQNRWVTQNCTHTFTHAHKNSIQLLSLFTHSSYCKENPSNQDGSVPLSPHLPCRN